MNELVEVLYFFIPAYVANMSPVLVGRSFSALATPIDGGRSWRGKRILGDHKTWRGLIAGVVAAVVTLELQKLAYQGGYLHRIAAIDYASVGLGLGVLLGLGTGIGDAVKSFFKRRVNIAPGGSWLVFDQLDFMAGACLLASPYFVPPLTGFLMSLPIIFAGSVGITALGYWLGMKESWI